MILFLLRSQIAIANHSTNREEDLTGHHGCDVLYELVKPWANTNRLVVADSFFASVTTAIKLKSAGLRFIGVVKTATKGYPMGYLGTAELMDGKGDMRGLLATDVANNSKILAFVWVDRDRRYFIATAGSLSPGSPIERSRMRQEDKEPNAEPVKAEIYIDQPEAADLYYSACGKIDQHNRHRQASLMLEKKLITRNWNVRVNQSLFGMSVVDSFLLMQGCQGNWLVQRQYYQLLAQDLIDNQYDTIGLRPRKRTAAEIEEESCFGPDKSLHLTSPTPTKKMKKGNKKHRMQGLCMVCKHKRKTSFVCRKCQDNQLPSNPKQHWICRYGRHLECMSMHIAECHPDCIAEDQEPVHYDD